MRKYFNVKCILGILAYTFTTSIVIGGTVPTADSFNWTLYDDFNSGDSYAEWFSVGQGYNVLPYWNLNEKMVVRSYATYQWSAYGHYQGLFFDDNLRGIKADISLKDTSYPAYGTGRNVIGMRVAPNLDVYLGFFSDGYTHNIQVGYRFNGEDVVPEDWASQSLTFEQEYEAAILLDDSGRNILFFLDNQLFEVANIYPASDHVEQFFIETDIEKSLNTDFSIDKFCVLVPEPTTLLLVGFGGLILRKLKKPWRTK